MGEMPLYLRRKQLMITYLANLQVHSEDRHPTKKVLLPCWERERAKWDCFAWSSERAARAMTLSQRNYISTVPLTLTPPWLLPSVILDFHIQEDMRKGFGDIAVLVNERLHTLYHIFVPVYTDGSKDPHTGRTGFSVTIPSLNVSVKRRTSDDLSVL